MSYSQRRYSMKNKRKILVTCARPYANDPIHLGHLVEYIQTDIWVRFQKLCGNTCYYICADNTHATPVMLPANQDNIAPQKLIDRMSLLYQQDFSGFNIHFDNYYSTHAEENYIFSETIYQQVIEKETEHYFFKAQQSTADYRLPTAVFCHGFLTVNGLKMSKPRGTFIQADCYLRYLPPEALRYYFATQLGNTIDDIDLNLKDFLLRVNSDLIGKVVNIASRCALFINKYFDGMLSPTIHDEELLDRFIDASDLIANLYEKHQYNQTMREIMSLADIANQYIAEYKPWLLIKYDKHQDEAHHICTQGINFYRLLMIYLKPVLPELAKNSEDFLNEVNLNWESIKSPLLNHRINQFTPLMNRIEKSKIDAMLADRQVRQLQPELDSIIGLTVN